MIRTRGLHRALRRVIGRALGTHVNGDADEAHQYRRSIAYARRQQAVAAVADNVEHVDHPADEVHEQSQEPLLMMYMLMPRVFQAGPKFISFDRLCLSCGSHSLGRRGTYYLNYIIFE